MKINMDYFERIQNTIDFIDDNLQSELTLDGLSKIACYSPYHFHRVFHVLTGESVMDYIRKRRLAKSLEELIVSNKNIIDIALSYQFNSHDSFTRAFKRLYKISPGEFRRSKKTDIIAQNKIILSERIILPNYKEFNLEPKIIYKESFKLLGFKLHTSIENEKNFKTIPEFWKYYNKNKLSDKVPGKKNKDIELGISFDFDSKKMEITYMIGFEVESIDDVLEGMELKIVPSSKYAVFTTPKSSYKDFTKSIHETIRFIIQKWFPNSGYEYNDNGVDIECYDRRRFINDKSSQIDIYVPVK